MSSVRGDLAVYSAISLDFAERYHVVARGDDVIPAPRNKSLQVQNETRLISNYCTLIFGSVIIPNCFGRAFVGIVLTLYTLIFLYIGSMFYLVLLI